jgi:hypothetical protein
MDAKLLLQSKNELQEWLLTADHMARTGSEEPLQMRETESNLAQKTQPGFEVLVVEIIKSTVFWDNNA